MNHELKKIIWIASYPKSGNTWLRIFLENILNPSASDKSINKLNCSLNASSRILIDNFSGISSAYLTEKEIEELRPKVYVAMAEQSDNKIFVKTHDVWSKTPIGNTLFPTEVTKGVIYIIRNPLDIAVSFSYHTSSSIDSTIRKMNSREHALSRNTKRNNHQVKQLLSDWSSHVTSWIDNSGLPIIVLRYEDMLKNPRFSFRRALDFIEIQVTEELFTKALRASNIDVLKEMEKNEGFTEKPIGMKAFFREGKSDCWKNHLNATQIKEICNTHLIQMKRFGYLPI